MCLPLSVALMWIAGTPRGGSRRQKPLLRYQQNVRRHLQRKQCHYNLECVLHLISMEIFKMRRAKSLKYVLVQYVTEILINIAKLLEHRSVGLN